jgi:hypothetical protein
LILRFLTEILRREVIYPPVVLDHTVLSITLVKPLRSFIRERSFALSYQRIPTPSNASDLTA